MNFEKLNEAGEGKHFLPTIKLKELKVNEIYIVTDVKRVQTKFGARIVVELENKFSVFLPKRMVKVFYEDKDLLDHLKNCCDKNQLKLKYLGGVYDYIQFI